MKKTFEVGGKTYAVISPSAKVRRESQMEHSRTFGRLLKEEGILTRAELDRLIEKKEIWDSESREKFKQLNKDIAESVATLERGNMKLNEARELAISISNMRADLNELMNEYRQYDDITADAQAEAAAMDYMVFKCLVDAETGKQIYKTFDEYLENKADAVPTMAYLQMLQIEYGSTNELYKKLPENSFLLEYGFVNDDLHFINKDGELVDKDGRPVNENHEYIDEEEPESLPFLDEDGNPIVKE